MVFENGARNAVGNTWTYESCLLWYKSFAIFYEITKSWETLPQLLPTQITVLKENKVTLKDTFILDTLRITWVINWTTYLKILIHYACSGRISYYLYFHVIFIISLAKLNWYWYDLLCSGKRFYCYFPNDFLIFSLRT